MREGHGEGRARITDDVVIACTLRSGSNLLADMLRANGFGEAREWFQDGPGAGTGGSARARQAASFIAGHAGQRRRAVKFDWRQFQRLCADAPDTLPLAALVEDFRCGHWLFLSRRNLAHQAVSLYAAQATGAWMGEATDAYDALEYDFELIHERFAWLAAEQFAWEAHFRATGIAPIRLVYEDLMAWPAAAWCELFGRLAPGFAADRLDLAPLGIPAPGQKRLAALKAAFQDDLLAGRQPRSFSMLLDEISGIVARAGRGDGPDGDLGRVAADLIASPDGMRLRKLDLRCDLSRDGPVRQVEEANFLDGVALRLDPGGAAGFAASGCRLMIAFYAHAWSGVAEIRMGEQSEQLDLYARRPETRIFVRDLPVGFRGPVTVRCGGARHRLSDGAEIWVQRVIVLADGRTALEDGDVRC